MTAHNVLRRFVFAAAALAALSGVCQADSSSSAGSSDTTQTGNTSLTGKITRLDLNSVTPQIEVDDGSGSGRVLQLDRFRTTVTWQDEKRSVKDLKAGQQIQASYSVSLGYRRAKSITITADAPLETAAASSTASAQPAAPGIPLPKVLRSDKKPQASGTAPASP